MKRAVVDKLLSGIFLMIFFCKVMISIAPIVAEQFDVKSVRAAILQLEIEHDAKPADVKEMAVKEYLTVTSCQVFAPTVQLTLDETNGNDDHAKHIQPFHPPVPTPPPNV